LILELNLKRVKYLISSLHLISIHLQSMQMISNAF